MATRVLVVGVGGLGGVLASHLFERDDVDAVGLTRNEQVIEAIADRGLIREGVGGEAVVRGPVVGEPPPGPFDWILLATQPPDVVEAAASVVDRLADRGAMVVLQNGLCEARVAEVCGSDRVVGAVVAFGASMPEPGVCERTSAGGIVLGRPDGSERGLRELAAILEPVGEVSITDHLAGHRWSKLAVNCAISTLGTIGGDRLGVLMRHKFARRLALEVITETVEVARAEGVRLVKAAGVLDLEWLAVTDDERVGLSAALVAKHGVLLVVGAKYRNLRSSMLYAIERGREPAVDYLNGEVIDHAERHGIEVPVNRAARDLVHAIAAGDAMASPDTLRRLADRVL